MSKHYQAAVYRQGKTFSLGRLLRPAPRREDAQIKGLPQELLVPADPISQGSLVELQSGRPRVILADAVNSSEIWRRLQCSEDKRAASLSGVIGDVQEGRAAALGPAL